MRNLLLPLALLVAATAAESAHDEPVPMHQPAIHFELAADSVVIPMTRVDGRIIVDTMIDGKGPFPFIFDTGAQGSVIDVEFAREQGLALGQEVRVGSPGGGGRQGYLVNLEKVGIGGLSLSDVPSVAFDGLPFPRSATSPRGVLGPYSLKGLLVTLDYPSQKLVFRRGELPEPDGKEVFGWDHSRPLPEIPATVGGQAVVVHLDSGSSGGLSLPPTFTDRIKLDGPLVDKGYAMTVDQVKPVRGAPLAGNFVIGRYTLEKPTIHFIDMSKDFCNLGAVILSQFAVTIDPANTRLRLAGPADGRLARAEDGKPHYGVQLAALEANPIQVVRVDAGSPAEKGGVRADDRITRMNGRPVEELGVRERVEALRVSPLALTVARGTSSVELTLQFE